MFRLVRAQMSRSEALQNSKSRTVHLYRISPLAFWVSFSPPTRKIMQEANGRFGSRIDPSPEYDEEGVSARRGPEADSAETLNQNMGIF